MPWREASLAEERFEFAILATKGERTFSALCAEFGISRQTGYTWWRRYREGSRDFTDRSRRPQHSPRRTAAELEAAVVAARQKRPDWGAPKLVKLLEQQDPPIHLKERTVHRILERHGLICPAERKTQAPGRFEREAPNDLWQMDFKGPLGFNKEFSVGPLSMLDDHSRFLLELRHLGSTRSEGVKRTLEQTFDQCGIPNWILIDHGTPWWNAASPWGLTELSVWIMRLGVRLTYSGIRHPQTQGKVERMHGALQRALRHRKTDLYDQAWLDEFRHEYNYLRPHAGLQMATPASRWKPSSRPFPRTVTEWEYPAGMQVHRLSGQGQLCWKGRHWEISNALRGQLIGIDLVDSLAVVYFCRTPLRELDLVSGDARPLPVNAIRSLNELNKPPDVPS